MRAARLFGILIGLLAVVIAVAYLLRMPLAGIAARSVMAGAGIENPKAEIAALSMDRIVLRDVAIGPNGANGIDIREIEARFNWRTVLQDRTVESINIGPGTIRAMVSPDGVVSLPGFISRNRDGNSSTVLPFSILHVSDLEIIIDTPEGVASGTLDADYDATTGGNAKIRIATERAGIPTHLVENSEFSLEASIDADDAVVAQGAFAGDAVTSSGILRDVDISIDANLLSWRSALSDGLSALSGQTQIDLKSATMNLAEVPATAVINSAQSEILFGGPVASLQLAGQINLRTAGGEIIADLGGRPLTIQADNGAALSVSENDVDALFHRTNTGDKASWAFDVSGGGMAVHGSVDAETTDDGWFVLAPVRLGDYDAERISFDDASAIVRVTTRPEGLTADITMTSALRVLSIGRMSVFDAPVETNFLIDANYANKTASISLPPDQCLTLTNARITIDQQDTEAKLKDATLCENNAPLAVVNWSDAMQSRFGGSLSAGGLQYRLGRTTINGRLPQIEFSGLYQPALHLTSITGDIAGGALVFNKFLVFSNADGLFDFKLDHQMMSATARMDRVRIVQNMDTPLVAPVLGKGTLQLYDRDVDFDYVLTTLLGERLGTGVGVHNVTTARGRSIFTFDRLEYVADGIQPSALAPVLKGVVGQTTGATTGEAEFEWAPNPIGLSSKANFQFEDITFVGPTRIVNQTIGVNGQMKLASLWPVKTDGVQTIRVSGVDFGALQIIEAGEIRFDMPGDETLHIEQAEFPWFGGRLGVYDARASLSGGEAVAPLRADNVDLSLVLDYADVDGLSGDGILSGVLPLVVQDGKASIENGFLQSNGSGAIRYQGQAGEQASAAGQDAQIAFDLLRDLRFDDLGVAIDGPLDGRLQFQLKFEGTGAISLREQNLRVPVIYRINLDAALLELLNQANMSQSIELQIQEALRNRE